MKPRKQRRIRRQDLLTEATRVLGYQSHLTALALARAEPDPIDQRVSVAVRPPSTSRAQAFVNRLTSRQHRAWTRTRSYRNWRGHGGAETIETIEAAIVDEMGHPI